MFWHDSLQEMRMIKVSQLYYAKINAKNVGWTLEMVTIF